MNSFMKQKKRRIKISAITYITYITIYISPTVCLSLLLGPSLFCKRAAPPVYASSQQTIFEGSLYYNEAGCSNCHGTAFDGKGPEAASLKEERGLETPNLTKIAAEKVALDYFKAITVGTKAMPDHTYRSYTDRGRWAMAHFLFSRAPLPTKEEEIVQRKAALQKAEAETEAAYSKNSRLWQLGYLSPEKRSRPPQLNSLIKKLAADSEAVAEADGEAADEKREAANGRLPVARSEVVRSERQQQEDLSHRGASLYLQNCAACHGRWAEGEAKAVRIGLVNCERKERRQCNAWLSTTDLALFSGSRLAFRQAHREKESLLMPSFAALGRQEWQYIYDYVRNVTAQPSLTDQPPLTDQP